MIKKNNDEKLKILFFPAGDINTPSTRIRCYGFAKELSRLGFKTKICGIKNCSTPYISFFLKLLHFCFYLPFYDILYFQKTVDWPIFLPYLLAHGLNKRAVFDIDDLPTGAYRKRANKILKMSDKVIVGSHFLLKYAKRFNENVVLIPTLIDREVYKIKEIKKKNSKIIIGWIGTPNLRYLKILLTPLMNLGKKYDIEFKIITDLRYKEKIPKFENVKTKLINWSLSTFAEELNEIDIGVMPLYEDEWSKGKGAYKLLEYMALSIPAVGSNVGENTYVIEDGINGFLASSEKDWVSRLSMLIEDEKLREKIGKNGRKTIEEKYSLRIIGKKLARIIIQQNA